MTHAPALPLLPQVETLQWDSRAKRMGPQDKENQNDHANDDAAADDVVDVISCELWAVIGHTEGAVEKCHNGNVMKAV